MPLEKIIQYNPETKIFIWKIDEDFDELFDTVVITDKNMMRLFGMKSLQHQLGFMSVRRLLQQAGYNDHDLTYDNAGKPHLNDGKFISISHSHQYSAIVVSNQNVGLDIERQREKITIIGEKFADYEVTYLDRQNQDDYIRRLTVIWGIKEAIFKIKSEPGISFKDHINVPTFTLQDKAVRAWLNFNDVAEDFITDFFEIDGYTLVIAFPNS